MNDTSHPASPSTPATAPVAPAAEDAPTESALAGATTLYKRTGRVPTLGFWIVIAFLAPVLVALIVSPFLQLGGLAGAVTLALDAALFVGVPLAAIVCLVEMLVLRARSRRTDRTDR